MWDEHHHYGALRRELCQFCIDYLEKEDAKQDDSGSVAGICEYVLDYVCDGPDEKGDTTHLLYKYLSEVFQKWPLARSNAGYPVEGVCSEFWRAVAHHTLWQNPRRIELLKWAIEYFKGVCDAEMD